MSNSLALIGLGVMGRNLALNLADHGHSVALWNYTPDLIADFRRECPHPNAHPYDTLGECVASLATPRRVFIMVTAGPAVDSTIEALAPLLSKGDIVTDLGNSNFHDTERRARSLATRGITFFGTGVSGGAEGARLGPAIMPGGPRDAYPEVGPILESIAARAEDGSPCCAYLGPGGSGHFVKMVHNGIEYADLQLIAEAYLILGTLGGADAAAIASIFRGYAEGPLRGYLIRIAAEVLEERDPVTGGALVDRILDSAGQKGTGKWTAVTGFEELTNLGVIDAACNARFSSAALARRERVASRLVPPATPRGLDLASLAKDVERTLHLGKIAAYAQGFDLYQAASRRYGWDLDPCVIASIFRGGCIIQADLLRDIAASYRERPDLEGLLEAPLFAQRINASLPVARQVVAQAITHGIPVPALSSAISYLDALRAPRVGANLIQAMRDRFGAHTFMTVDGEGPLHHEWGQAKA